MVWTALIQFPSGYMGISYQHHFVNLSRTQSVSYPMDTRGCYHRVQILSTFLHTQLRLGIEEVLPPYAAYEWGFLYFSTFH